MKKTLLPLLFATVLSGCGVIYISPTISESVDGKEVDIVKLTPDSVSLANSSPYMPRELPSIFSSSVGPNSVQPPAEVSLPGPTQQRAERPGRSDLILPPPTIIAPYEIGVGDVLVLATVQAATSIEELSGLLAAQNRRQGYTVQDDGAIAIPDVGRVQMEGLNLEEAEAAVFNALVENQLDPTFSIEVAEFNSQRVTIGGAVLQSTVLPISLAPLTLQEAVAATGGYATTQTEFIVFRIFRDGKLYQIPFDELAENNIVLQAGDNIFVDAEFQLEEAQAYFEEQITLSTARQSARSAQLSQLQTQINILRGTLTEERQNFRQRLDLGDVERDYVYIVGEVATQGRFTMPFGTNANLADALFEKAKGINPTTGNPRAIYVVRGNSDDTVTAYHLDASVVSNLVLATRFQLRPNDVVFVAQQPVTKFNRVVQQLTTALIITSINAATN